MAFEHWMVALGIVLIVEGVGPCLFPNKWRAYMMELSKQNQSVLQRMGGSLLVAGIVLLVIFS